MSPAVRKVFLDLEPSAKRELYAITFERMFVLRYGDDKARLQSLSHGERYLASFLNDGKWVDDPTHPSRVRARKYLDETAELSKDTFDALRAAPETARKLKLPSLPVEPPPRYLSSAKFVEHGD